jgi:hypothetical protein
MEIISTSINKLRGVAVWLVALKTASIQIHTISDAMVHNEIYWLDGCWKYGGVESAVHIV